MDNTSVLTSKPIHKGTLISTVIVSIVGAIHMSLIAPNLPFIIRGFQDKVILFSFHDLQIEESMVSYYVALISTMYFLGSTVGCVCWGWIADRLGRKVTIIACLLCMSER